MLLQEGAYGCTHLCAAELLEATARVSAMHGPDGQPPGRVVRRVPCTRGHALPQAPEAKHLPPPRYDVTRADLREGTHLVARHQHTIARGWLKGSDAPQRNVVATAGRPWARDGDTSGHAQWFFPQMRRG